MTDLQRRVDKKVASSGVPAWWCDAFPDTVSRREAMPGVERWQTTHVRYRRFPEAQVAQGGWDLSSSRRNYEHLVRSEQQHFLPEDHPLFTGIAPSSVNIKIVEAPAEFAVPVKQDRRLAPSFKVRVEVKYRQAVSFPLTLKAFVVSQQDKDNILNWYPDEASDSADKQKPVTDLKGTMCITHHFEASNGTSGSQYNSPGPLSAGMLGGPQSAFAFASGGSGSGPNHRNPGLPSVSTQDQQLLGLEAAMAMYNQQQHPTSSKHHQSQGQGLGQQSQQGPGSHHDMHRGGGSQSQLGGHQGHGGGGGGRDSQHGRGGSGMDSNQHLSSQLQGSGLSSLLMDLQQQAGGQLGPPPAGLLNGGGGGSNRGMPEVPMAIHGLMDEGMSLAGMLNQHSLQQQLQQQKQQLQQQQAQQQPGFLLNLFGDHGDMKMMEQLLMQPQGLNGGSGNSVHHSSANINLNNGAGGSGGNSSGLFNNLSSSNMSDADFMINQHTAAVQQKLQHNALQQQYNMLSTMSSPANSLGPLGSLSNGLLSNGLPSGLLSGSMLASNGPLMGTGPPSAPDAYSLVQDFDFANLEFLKPTRMNKVYMVFACTVLDLDTLFVVYNVPTIGICRAEQREKACQKLGVAFSSLSHFENVHGHNNHHHGTGPNIKSEPAAPLAAALAGSSGLLHGGSIGGGMQYQQQRDREREPMREGTGGMPSKKREGGSQQGKLDLNNAGSLAMKANDMLLFGNDGGLPQDVQMPAPRSRLAMREWIQEEYESTGLNRKLSGLDMQALLSQAGFPMNPQSGEHVSISQVQWDEFGGQFRRVLSLLRQIAPVWNMEDPCVISGFDMDRLGTVNALVNEPAGTFICRFSMSQPGCLVLSCKVTGNHPKADDNGLIQAIIKIDDLNERRVDTWIRDFAGATHVLDVYRQKRVDKRKVFASNYMRLRGLEVEAPPDIDDNDM